ncbi:MAG: hypothetical protein NW237_14240 [Cyanobacteriota bacterium]|nr:hypothetical protein [Cyanobacteriota bacterium]
MASLGMDIQLLWTILGIPKRTTLLKRLWLLAVQKYWIGWDLCGWWQTCRPLLWLGCGLKID